MDLPLQEASKYKGDDQKTMELMRVLVSGHLVRILRSATDLDTLTSCMYAIQEILKLAQVSSCVSSLLNQLAATSPQG